MYATLLGIAGFMLLWFGANPLACWLGVMGMVYVGVYSLYMKRHSVYGTLIGSLSGAAPPVIGYCAVTGEFDSGNDPVGYLQPVADASLLCHSHFPL